MYSINPQPKDLELKKLFVYEKKIPVVTPTAMAASKRRFFISIFTLLITLNIFFALRINSKVTPPPEVQKFHLTAAAPLPSIPEKEIITRIVNQFVASVQVSKAIVRGGPGAENPIIHSLELNEKVIVIGWNKNWMNIEVNKGNEKITGWIRADLIGGMPQ